MIRSLERHVRSARDFLYSEQGMIISGGLTLATFAVANMHFSGMSGDVAETLVNTAQRSFF